MTSARIGPYEVLGELARGGMGVVLRARDPRLGREVAIKLLLRPESPVAWERFRREAAALSRLDHPGVVPVFEVGVHEGRPYLVTPLVEGVTLEERLRRQGPLPPVEAAALVARLAQALEHAHARGLVHRDLKPGNVLLDARGEPRLIDFGLVRDQEVEGLSRTGMFLGTPGFWAPEQMHGAHDQVGPRTDVYGLGATLWAALVGRPPFEGGSLAEVMVAQEQAPPPPSTRRAGIPPILDAVCVRAMAIDPAQRYASAAELAAALGGVGRPLRAAPAARRSALVAGGLLAGALAAAAGVLLMRGRSAAPPPPPAKPAPVDEPAPQARDDDGQAWSPEVMALARAAGDALMAGDVEGCERGARRALELEPRCTDALLFLALVAERRGDAAGALGRYDHVLELEPGRADVINLRGYLLLRTGEPRAAAAEFQRAIALRPALAQYHLNLGLAHEQLGEWPRAFAAADRAAELEPGNAYAFNNRGWARSRLGERAAAREDLAHAVALAPGCREAWSNLARLELEDGRPEAALAAAEGGLRAAPGWGTPHGQRGAALAQLGRLEEALQEFDAALRLLPPDDDFRPVVEGWRARTRGTLEGR